MPPILCYTFAGYTEPDWLVLYIAYCIFIAPGLALVFHKAEEPWWAAFIPFYNIIVWLRLVGRPWWWMFLLAIPIVDIFILLQISLDLAKDFGKGTLFGLGLAFLPFILYWILGLGKAEYKGSLIF